MIGLNLPTHEMVTRKEHMQTRNVSSDGGTLLTP